MVNFGAGMTVESAIIQDMSKTEIIAELAQLSSGDLADVKAWLDRFASGKSISKSNGASTADAHIRSPRLANPAQSRDFVKQVRELPADAAL